MKNIQERAEIFVEKYGEWDSTEYICWITRMIGKFEEETGKRTNNNRDEFTEFLRKQEVDK